MIQTRKEAAYIKDNSKRYTIADDGKDHTPIYKNGVDSTIWAKPMVISVKQIRLEGA